MNKRFSCTLDLTWPAIWISGTVEAESAEDACRRFVAEVKDEYKDEFAQGAYIYDIRATEVSE